MALLLTHDARVDDPQEQFLRTINTRIAGGGRLKATAEPPRIVVDVREFRSSLPSLIHGRSIRIIPCQLTVGDYILTPEICVERKSVKDLIQSFANGRLFNQCENMCLHYSTPVVLIEFDASKSFTLEPFASYEGSIDQGTLQSKITLLALSFPRVRIIWSSSPFQTAEIFESLKSQNAEPDPFKAVMYGLLDSAAPNQMTLDLLDSMPGVKAGVGSWNLMQLANSIRDLCECGIDEIIGAIGPVDGRTLWRFINRDLTA